MEDESVNILKVLNNVSKSIYKTKTANKARIQNIDIIDKKTKGYLFVSIMNNLDSSLLDLKIEIQSVLNLIPIYNLFLKNIEGLSLYDCADLICLIRDIDRFPEFKYLLSYAGYTPNAKHFNKDLYKLLLKLSSKLKDNNPKYQFVFENNLKKYQQKHPDKTDEHIINMAKRIVIKRFLKNLYISWVKIEEGI